MEKKWLVFYTKSRHEEKVRDRLTKGGYEVFLPMQQVMRQWSDRRKKVMVPLFNSYIFVFEGEPVIEEIVKTPGISWNVRHNNKPATLHPKEFESINRFLETGLYIETLSIPDLKVGDHVEVAEGPLKGISGRLIHTPDGEKFSVTLSVLGSSMVVKLDSRLIQRKKV
jgi:transcription antitermination factor NusG